MLRSKLLSVLVLLSIASIASSCCSGDECTCEPNCWEKCFMNPPNSQTYKNAYMEIYRAAVGIRNMYAPCFKPHGTAYMMDADVPTSGSGTTASSLYWYQRQLASIVAMVQPVGDNCNPFCTSKFFRNFAWYAHNWPCKDRCQAWSFFQKNTGMTSYTPNQAWQQQPSWVRGGEILSKLCFDRPNLNGHKCMKCTKNELLIAFTNSPIYPAPSSVCGGNPYQCAAIGVHPANHANMDSWAKTGPAYHLPSTSVYRYAASRISRCMYYQCCRYKVPNTWTPKPKFPASVNPGRFVSGRSMEKEVEEIDDLEDRESEQVFNYMNSKDERLQEFKGTLDGFNAIIKREVEGSTTITKG